MEKIPKWIEGTVRTGLTPPGDVRVSFGRRRVDGSVEWDKPLPARIIQKDGELTIELLRVEAPNLTLEVL